MAVTRDGWCCLSALAVSVLLIILGFVFDSISKPNGDLGIYYAVDTCVSKSESFDLASFANGDFL